MGLNKQVFDQHLDKESNPPHWMWTGSVFQETGYGQYSRVEPLAHRAAYILYVGPIPEGMTIDHTCNAGKLCVNPFACLEVVTSLVNNQRSSNYVGATHCVAGHEFTDENTYWQPPSTSQPSGQRVCRKCKARRARERRYNVLPIV